MRLNVHVSGKHVAQLYRERDEYVLRYTADASAADFVSLAMPVPILAPGTYAISWNSLAGRY